MKVRVKWRLKVTSVAGYSTSLVGGITANSVLVLILSCSKLIYLHQFALKEQRPDLMSRRFAVAGCCGRWCCRAMDSARLAGTPEGL